VGDEKLQDVLAAWFPRFLANGLDYLDVRRTLDRVAGWDDWADAWEASAAAYAELADEADAAGHRVTAAEHRRRAALTLQFGQFALNDDPARREALHRRQADLFRRAAPALDPPARPLEGLHGYVRVPAGVECPGVVLLVPGLESTKEQFSTFEPYFLARGVATVSFEGAGQGEARYEGPFRDARWGRAFDELVRALPSYRELDPERVVVLGTSFGGYLALRHAARVPGLRGVVDIAGPYDLCGLEELLPVLQDGFAEFVGAADREQARELLRDVTLDGALDGLTARVLVVHGARDNVIPVEHAHRIAAALGPRAELRLEPGGNHSCNNLHTVVRPAVADWVCDRLEEGR
jgi:alpha-beta hydrolase superfamily lysophospholipase